MPRTLLRYQVADVSAAARSLRDQLQKLERLPSHVEILNMLARAAGFRNFQHFRAQTADANTSRLPPSRGRRSESTTLRSRRRPVTSTRTDG